MQLIKLFLYYCNIQIILYGFVYQVMIYKHITCYIIIFLKKICSKNRKAKNINKKQLVISKANKKKSIKKVLKKTKLIKNY